MMKRSLSSNFPLDIATLSPLLALWLASAISATLAWFLHVTLFSAVSGLVSFVFIVALIWVLTRARPAADELPDLAAPGKSRLAFGWRLMLILAAVLAIFVIGMMIGTSVSLLLVISLLGLGLTLTWQHKLDRRLLRVGATVGLIVGLGTALLGDGDFGWAIFTGICVIPAFISGMLLIRRTGLAHSKWMNGRVALGLQSFLWGCVLALPAALLNLLGNLQAGDTWVRHVWQSLYAFVPALAEETWARLFLTTLIYAALRPVSGSRPRRAVVAAILIGALVHGFAHSGINPFGIVIGSLLYGLPTALLFIKKDFEHAIGYHFLVDFVRFLAAFLQG
jgi:hypothetical protein